MAKRIAIFAALACAPLGAGAGAIGCRAEAPPNTDQVYSVALTVATRSDLPGCTSSLAGTVAYVTSPPSLWRCAFNQWTPIMCTANSAGSVAYASGTQTLFACVSRQWTPIALPEAGPPGPPGPQGEGGVESLINLTAEPPGPNCAAGGERIDVGVDKDGDGVLQPSEIAQTAYVCNGLNADATATIDAADADAGKFIPPGLLDYPDAYVTALCTGFANCCGAGFDPDICKQRNVSGGYDNTLPANANTYPVGNLTFDPDAAAGCTAALRNWPCGATISSAQNQAILAACHNVLGGTIPIDGSTPCMSSFECVSGAYCNAGTCTALVTSGGTCSPSAEGNDWQCRHLGTGLPAAFCNLYPDDGGGAARTGKCAAALATGTTSLCSDLSNFYSDYACTSQLCDFANTGACVASTTNPADPTSGYACSDFHDAGGGG